MDVPPKLGDSRLNSGRVIRLFCGRTRLRTFVQYLVSCCNRPEAASDVQLRIQRVTFQHPNFAAIFRNMKTFYVPKLVYESNVLGILQNVEENQLKFRAGYPLNVAL